MNTMKLTKEEKLEMVDTINDYLYERDFSGDECDHENCITCSFLEECYSEANSVSNLGFAEAIGYGGYDSEDEFWEQV